MRRRGSIAPSVSRPTPHPHTSNNLTQPSPHKRLHPPVPPQRQERRQEDQLHQRLPAPPGARLAHRAFQGAERAWGGSVFCGGDVKGGGGVSEGGGVESLWMWILQLPAFLPSFSLSYTLYTHTHIYTHTPPHRQPNATYVHMQTPPTHPPTHPQTDVPAPSRGPAHSRRWRSHRPSAEARADAGTKGHRASRGRRQRAMPGISHGSSSSSSSSPLLLPPSPGVVAAPPPPAPMPPPFVPPPLAAPVCMRYRKGEESMHAYKKQQRTERNPPPIAACVSPCSHVMVAASAASCISG